MGRTRGPKDSQEEPMAVQYQTRTARQETPQQWNRALARALADALDVLTEPTSGATFVESATEPGTIYAVTTSSCTCKAGGRGIPCKHRACLLAQMGILPLDDDEPLTPAPTL